MDYKKKYKDLLERARKLRDKNCNGCKMCMESLFDELAESEDERIRKDLCKAIWTYIPTEEGQEYIAWLEKQGKKPKKVSIWKHWKDGIAGNAEGEQVFLQKIGRNYCISSCLGCECDYIELSELDKLMREEKQEKSKWTEDDEKNLNDLDVILFEYKDIPKENYWHIINWLKLIKQRMEE